MLQVDDSLVASYPLVIENKCIVLLQVTLLRTVDVLLLV